MLHLSSTPAEAYSRVDLDARIEGSDGAALTRLCLEAVVEALGRARAAARRDNRGGRTEALWRAVTIIACLRRSVDPQSPVSGALYEFYDTATRISREGLSRFDDSAFAALQQDFADILEASFAG